MYRVIKPRGGGKTTELLHLAEETGTILVSHCPQYVKKLAKEEGINDDIQIMSYSEFIHRVRGSNEKFLLDEIDALLETLYHDNIIGYSLSPED